MQRGFDLPAKLVKPGKYPIVYSNGVGGTHSKAMVNGPGVSTGRSGTLGKIFYIEDDFWPHNTTLWVTNFRGNDPKFISYLYQSVGFEKFASGSGVPTLNRNDAHSFLVRLPCESDEQKVIAQALSDIDDLIASLDALITKKRYIKQGAMQQLFTGSHRLSGFAGEWSIARLQESCSFITKGATPTTYGFGWQDSGVRFLRSECVSERGLDLAQSSFISEKSAHFFRRGEVSGGDVLITITGNVGRVALLAKSFGTAIINQHIARLRVLPGKAFAPFIYHYLSQRNVRDFFVSIVTGQAYPQISLKQVRDMEIPLPSYDEQTAVANTLTDLDCEILLAESKLRKFNDIRQGMMQQLLAGRIRLV